MGGDSKPSGYLLLSAICLVMTIALPGISELRVRSKSWSFFEDEDDLTALDRVKFGVIAFIACFAWVFLISAEAHFVQWARGGLRGWFGLSHWEARATWRHLLADIPTFAAFAVMFSYSTQQGEELLVRLLETHSSLGPGGKIRSLLGEIDTGVKFASGGLELALDSEFLSAVKERMIRAHSPLRKRRLG